AAPADGLAAPGPVGLHGPRRLLARLRALADGLRLMPLPRRVPPPAPGHDHLPLAAQAPGLRALAADVDRAVALDARPCPEEPAALPLRGAPHPARRRHGRLPADVEGAGAAAARAPGGPAARALLGIRSQRAPQGAPPAGGGARPDG